MEEKKNNKERSVSYLIKSNNYVGLLFFALVLASLLYILKSEESVFKEIEPTSKSIIEMNDVPVVLENDNKKVLELRKYTNLGDENTFKIYQSSYNVDGLDIDKINNETLLYMAYKYLVSNENNIKNRYITCEEAALINLDKDIIECGGTKNNLSYYTVNYAINRQVLKNTIRKLYNINLKNFTNFYTTEDNLCYYINNEYLCVSHFKDKDINNRGEVELVKALKYSNKIEIIEKYKYIKDGIYYKGFNSNEVGEENYISTFLLVNGEYYYTGTEIYREN